MKVTINKHYVQTVEVEIPDNTEPDMIPHVAQANDKSTFLDPPQEPNGVDIFKNGELIYTED